MGPAGKAIMSSIPALCIFLPDPKRGVVWHRSCFYTPRDCLCRPFFFCFAHCVRIVPGRSSPRGGGTLCIHDARSTDFDQALTPTVIPQMALAVAFTVGVAVGANTIVTRVEQVELLQ